jgi:histidine triad (HIT) family protein
VRAATPCLFCRVIAGELPAHVVHADENCIAFLDNAPAARGHTLVVPREHISDLWSAPPETAAALGRTCAAVAQRIRERLAPDGLTLRQNTGAASGQNVFHLHVHLVPRWHGDGTVGWPWPPPASHDPDEVLHLLCR